jgi:hypothetical protein
MEEVVIMKCGYGEQPRGNDAKLMDAVGWPPPPLVLPGLRPGQRERSIASACATGE